MEECCHSIRPYSSWSIQALCPNWLDTSNSIWILQTVTGYKFPVTLHNLLSNSSPSSRMTTVYQEVDKLTKLLSHQIICHADPQIPGFYFHVFTCSPKENMKCRLITNLRNLNLCIPHFHLKWKEYNCYKMHCSRALNWMVKINLKDTYYIIMIHSESQELLQFWWNHNPSSSNVSYSGFQVHQRVSPRFSSK